ncbi:hypothetical protein D5F11_009270 [Siminovitchia terrae]|nr:hypothetical protein [Siminovitchia terrae]RST59898.1 hypothetical protein D5F11_009270 [Siminovitchia terrae]
MIDEMDVASRHLNVCIHYIHNCGKCSKCKRTLLILDILGVIDKYKNVFKLEYFYSVKDAYINKVIAKNGSNELLKEIYDEMVKTKYLDKWKES